MKPEGPVPGNSSARLVSAFCSRYGRDQAHPGPDVTVCAETTSDLALKLCNHSPGSCPTEQNALLQLCNQGVVPSIVQRLWSRPLDYAFGSPSSELVSLLTSKASFLDSQAPVATGGPKGLVFLSTTR